MILKPAIILIFLCFFPGNGLTQSNAKEHFPDLKNFLLDKQTLVKTSDQDQKSILEIKSEFSGAGLSVKNVSFFCEIEQQLEKKTKILPRVRLGDVDYVNALEKNNSIQHQLRQLQLNGY